MSDTPESGSPRLRLGPQAYALAMREAGGERLSQDHLERAITRLAGNAASGSPDADLRKAIDALSASIAHLRYVVLAAVAPSDEEFARALDLANGQAIETTTATLKQLSLDLPVTDRVLEELTRRQEELAQQTALEMEKSDPEIERD